MALFTKLTFSHKVEGEVLHITYTGKIRRKEILEIMSKIYKLVDLHKSKKILIDALKSDVFLEVNDIVVMAKAHPASFKKAKTAIVEKPKLESQYSLYQMVAENNDINLKFFPELKEAEAWLAS
jgi:stage II sporulation SpoAA-like protein